MKRKERSFKQRPILAFVITFVCVFALVGIGADLSKKVVKGDERVIELADSPVRILLKGSETYRVSLDGKSFSRELPQRNEIRLRGKVFDPLVNPPQMPEFTKAHVPGGIKLYIVQCVTQALPVFQEKITAAGGEICGTLPHHALIVAMSGDAFSKVQGMKFVRWVGNYHPYYKLEPGLEEVSRMAEATKTHYSLWLAKKNKQNEVADFISGIGGDVVLKGKSRRMEAKLNSNQLQRTAGNPWVLAIDRWTPKEEDMSIVREIGGANYLETVQGYTGQGVRAEVMDGGLRTTHVDFQATPPLIYAGNSTSTSHGTSVYGIVFGDGTGSADARGMLPDAEQPIFSCYNCFTDRYAHTQGLVNPAGPYRAVFQTNSWGNAQTMSYTTVSAEMDEIIFDLDILICQSQSNMGNQYSRPQAWAKNILAVGGVRHYDTLSRSDECWCTSASIGPAEDGRIKPDIWHFYDYIRTTYYSSDTAYTNTFGGTSGATPITAGHMGLIFQMWADGVFSGGPGQGGDVFDNRPHHTTAKALLIHSAYQYPFSGTSHDWTRNHQGWGMADVGNLYDMAEAHGWGFPVLIDESAVLAPLDTHTYNVNVSAGAAALKATMVYSDPPGVPGAAVHRINDLSLKVTAPNGTTYYWGNNGLDVGVWSTSGGSSNSIDTVENVFVQNPAAGTWTVQVFGDEIVQDGHVETGAIDADYALIVSGGDSGPVDPPPDPPTGLTATAGLKLVNLDWNDNTEPDLASYNVKRSTTSGGPYTQVGNVTVSNYTDNGVTAGTTYYYVVTAVDTGSHESGNSNEASATPYDNPPAAPTGLSATAAACDQVNLAWTDNSDNETSFKIERGTDGVNFSQIDTVGANITSYSDTTVAQNTTYYYRVRAANAFGDSGYSNTASAATPLCGTPPAAPTNLKAKGKGKAKINLTWTDNATNEDGFKIYRGTDGVNFNLLDTVGPNIESYDDFSAQSGITYYYKVCAYNSGGESCSNVASASKK